RSISANRTRRQAEKGTSRAVERNAGNKASVVLLAPRAAAARRAVVGGALRKLAHGIGAAGTGCRNGLAIAGPSPRPHPPLPRVGAPAARRRRRDLGRGARTPPCREGHDPADCRNRVV